jgi:hypothetical protein
MFAKEPGVYKLIWDNSFSWFTSKTLRYSLSVLKPITTIDIKRTIDFESIGFKLINDSSSVSIEQVQPSPHWNRFLIIYFENKHRWYKIDNICNKASYIKSNSRYLVIPVLVSNNRFRIMLSHDIVDFGLDKENEANKDVQFNQYFEKMIGEYFTKVKSV